MERRDLFSGIFWGAVLAVGAAGWMLALDTRCPDPGLMSSTATTTGRYESPKGVARLPDEVSLGTVNMGVTNCSTEGVHCSVFAPGDVADSTGIIVLGTELKSVDGVNCLPERPAVIPDDRMICWTDDHKEEK
jgi:hypothetical protein